MCLDSPVLFTMSRLGISLALMGLLSACQHRTPTSGWPMLIFVNLYPNGVPFSLKGPPPVILTFEGERLPDLSGVNQDYFFPSNPAMVLVAEDAYRAGLFDPKNHRFVPSRAKRQPSPDGIHAVEIHHLFIDRGPQNVLRLTDAADTVLQNRWSPGVFTGVFWSPDGTRYGFNESHPDKGDRRALRMYERASGEEVHLELRFDSSTSFFTNDQLERQASLALRHWLTPNQFVVWVHGPFDGPLMSPQWGYEALVDLSVPAPAANARMLRAFVRR